MFLTFIYRAVHSRKLSVSITYLRNMKFALYKQRNVCMKKIFLLLSLIVAAQAFACDEEGKTGFLPENDLNIPVSQKSINGVNESVFNQVIDEVSAVYRPIIEGAGDSFEINRKWSDGTVNASAQRLGSKVIVNMYGGLARHNLITKDGFAIVLCHEIGHHLGGAPKVKRLIIFNSWASNEGQSDYFATYKCFRRTYGNDDNISFISNIDVDATVREKCEEVYKNESEAALCMRASMAAKSTADLLSSLGRSPLPKFDTPDPSVVTSTNHAHPKGQCRLDTYFQGALCDRHIDDELSNKDPNQGTCNRARGDDVGLRSLCWFKPSK